MVNFVDEPCAVSAEALRLIPTESAKDFGVIKNFVIDDVRYSRYRLQLVDENDTPVHVPPYENKVTITQFRELVVPQGFAAVYTVTRGKAPPFVHYSLIACSFSVKFFFVKMTPRPRRSFYGSIRYRCTGFLEGDCAFYMAYCMADGRDAPSPYYEHVVDLTSKATHDMLRVIDRKIEVDVELYQIANSTTEEPPTAPFQPLLEPIVEYPECYRGVAETVAPDDDVYMRFASKMQQIIAYQDKEIKFTGHAVGDNLVTPHTALFCDQKNTIDAAALRVAVEKDGFLPLIGCKPKPGVTTSTGEMRAIFPMYLAYELVLRSNIRKRECPRRLNNPSSFCLHKEYNYSYDAIKCDKQMFPYYVKYAFDNKLEYLLLPIVVAKYRKYLMPTQFPSGIYGTSWFTEAYVESVVESIGVKDFYIQGDAIITKEPMFDKRFKKNKNCVLNGFYYGKDIPYFVNQDKIAKPRCKTRLVGMDRYNVLHAAYNIMGAKLDKYPAPQQTLATASDIQRYCSDRGTDANIEIGDYHAKVLGICTSRAPLWDLGRVMGVTENIGAQLPKLNKRFRF